MMEIKFINVIFLKSKYFLFIKFLILIIYLTNNFKANYVNLITAIVNYKLK